MFTLGKAMLNYRRKMYLNSSEGGWIVSSIYGTLVKEPLGGMCAFRRIAPGHLDMRVESVSALPMLQRCHIVHMTVPARCICLTFGTGVSGRFVVPLRWQKRTFRCGKPS